MQLLIALLEHPIFLFLNFTFVVVLKWCVVFSKVESQMSPSAFCTATVKFIEPTQGAPIMIEVYDLF